MATPTIAEELYEQIDVESIENGTIDASLDEYDKFVESASQNCNRDMHAYVTKIQKISIGTW